MRRVWMSLLGAVGLLAVLAGPAFAQEPVEKAWRLDGKRWVLVPEKLTPAPESPTVRIEVPRGEHKEGDILALKTVGKTVERIYLREVPRPEPVVEKGHFCNVRVVTVMKHVEFRHFCKVDGAEKPCPGMKGGECLAVVK